MKALTEYIAKALVENPDQIANSEKSYTGKYLKKMLKK